MTFGLVLLMIGVPLAVAGYKGYSLREVLTGERDPDSGSRDLLPTLSGGAATYSGGAFEGGGTTEGAAPSGYPLARQGKVIGKPYGGTHTLGNWQSDRAVDISIPVGVPVLAVESGTIIKTGGQAGSAGRFAGYNLTLKGRDEYFYAHLSKLSVRAGQQVKRGDVIGLSGSANGVPHLHFASKNANPTSIVQ